MKRQAVSSSNLASLGYNTDNEILEVEFNNGDIYQFFKVPKEVFNELMGASSHGVYFSANIRNKYQHDKL